MPAPTHLASHAQILAATSAHLTSHTLLLAALPPDLARALESQAWLLAYNDVYRVTAILLILLAPWAFLLKRAPVDSGATIVPE